MRTHNVKYLLGVCAIAPGAQTETSEPARLGRTSLAPRYCSSHGFLLTRRITWISKAKAACGKKTKLEWTMDKANAPEFTKLGK